MSARLATRLFAQRRFAPLFVLFQTGTLNDNLLKQALISLVTFGGVILFSENIPRSSIVPIAALLFTLPFLIVCAIAGQLADKFDRGRILRWIKRFEMGLMVIAAIGFFTESVAVLCVALVGMGAQSAFFSPTKNAVLPQWLDDDELITGNGLLSGFQFFIILLGQVIGGLIVLMDFGGLSGGAVIGIALLVFAAIGWFAAEQTPAAPPPQPDLKVDYNPITAIIRVLAFAWKDQNVFRPLLGIAWFYGMSTIFVTAFPTYVADVMGYDQNVLYLILAASTVGILVGSLLCIVLARGKEAVGLLTVGIVGVTLFTLDLWRIEPTAVGAELGGLDAFFADPNGIRFLIDAVGASVCNGFFIVPLQAMAQRRANPERRAQLMSAGAVMLNFAVNAVTGILIGLGYLALPPDAPFLFVVVVSAGVSAYAASRWLHYRKLERTPA